MSWSPQQEHAIKAVQAWLANPKSPQIFRLFGYAGSGKTTLAKHLAADVKGPVHYACFTGKAALVLRKKGCEGASTIHSLIYKAMQDEVTGEYTFKLNPDSSAAYASLIVVDEVSMVGEELARDLLSYRCKVLVLGDPAQLPPVKGEGFFINGQPDVMLTEVHRQAAENPIIRMSMDIREGRGLAPGSYGESRVVRRAEFSKDSMREMVLGSDQLLCGLNRSRQTFNQRIRELKGLTGIWEEWAPAAGDRLVCLRNNREKNLFNGGLWNVEKIKTEGEKIGMRVESLDEPDTSPVDIEVPAPFFNGTDKDLDWRKRRESDEFTYGWALTCHKSQGSQWDNVVVFDESRAFREDADKWLYTAVTRAAERVTVVV
jgi:exodeoxyribonuclease V